MSCNNTGSCPYMHKVTEVRVPTEASDGKYAQFTVTNPMVNNMERFCWRLCVPIGGLTQTLPVYMVLDDKLTPLLDKYGRHVTLADVQQRVVYKGWFVQDSEAKFHVITDNLPFRKCPCACNGQCG